MSLLLGTPSKRAMRPRTSAGPLGPTHRPCLQGRACVATPRQFGVRGSKSRLCHNTRLQTTVESIRVGAMGGAAGVGGGLAAHRKMTAAVALPCAAPRRTGAGKPAIPSPPPSLSLLLVSLNGAGATALHGVFLPPSPAGPPAAQPRRPRPRARVEPEAPPQDPLPASSPRAASPPGPQRPSGRAPRRRQRPGAGSAGRRLGIPPRRGSRGGDGGRGPGGPRPGCGGERGRGGALRERGVAACGAARGKGL